MALPLESIRVVDMGTVLAGPLVGQFLADLGAQVIKVESRLRLDGTRRGRPIVGEDIAGGDQGLWPDLQPLFHSINRNKLSITVNVKHPEGLALVRDLICVSDVVINNYSPGVMDRAGLGYTTLRALKPDIIMASMPGAGETGPLRDLLAYASVTSAMAGLMGLIGYEDGDLTGQVQGPWCDIVAALTTFLAILAALWHRQHTGRGQYIEVAHLEAAVALLVEALMDYQMNGRVYGPQGTRHPIMAPHGHYRCRGEDKWVSIPVETEEEWLALCKVMGQPELASDPRFIDAAQRQHHVSDLDQYITRWTRSLPPEEATRALQAQGVPAAPVMTIQEQFTDPHLREREALVELEHPRVGAEWVPGLPWRLSATPGSVRRHAPLLGEHNEYVFRHLLGRSAAELERLIHQEAVA